MRRQISFLGVIGIMWWGCQATTLASPETPVEEFVRKIFIHGVPFERAKEFQSNANIEKLKKKLEEKCIAPYDLESAFCSNIVVTLGIIGSGDEEAVEKMIDFIKTTKGTLSLPEFRARTSAVIALGYLINGDKGSPVPVANNARDCLGAILRGVPGLRKEYWNEEVNSVGCRNLPVEKDELKDQLRRSAVIGLALSGDPDARTILEEILKQPATRDDASFQALIIEALDALNTILVFDAARKKGLVCYYDGKRTECDIEQGGTIHPAQPPLAQEPS